MNRERFIKELKGVVGENEFFENEPMKRHTSFKIGGPADYLVMPSGASHMAYITALCMDNGVPFFVMGNGTNLIVSDGGIRGVVIKTCGSFNSYRLEGEELVADSGVLLSELSGVALENGLTGLEFASGIPGTLGGAVTMNAGAYGPEMKDVVVETEFLDAGGVVRRLTGEEHEFGYRTSCLQRHGGLVLSSRLRLKRGNREEIKALMEDLNARRKRTQPLELPSAGSVFRRPEGYYTGKLIQDCGLKGMRIGGAEISGKHCGFIVNTGNATARDVTALIRHVQDTVMEKFGVKLVTEVKFVGEERVG